MRVRQNLALVVGLQGRFEEMAQIDPTAPVRSVEANRAALQEMIAPARDYAALSDTPPTQSMPAQAPVALAPERPEPTDVAVSKFTFPIPEAQPELETAPAKPLQAATFEPEAEVGEPVELTPVDETAPDDLMPETSTAATAAFDIPEETEKPVEGLRLRGTFGD